MTDEPTAKRIHKPRAFAPMLLDQESAYWLAQRVAAHVIGTQHAPPGSLEKLVGDEIIKRVHEEARLVQFLRANKYRGD